MVKKLFRKARKTVKKIIPKEIRPFVPYIAAAMGPAGLAGTKFATLNPAFQKAILAGATRFATDDEADLKDLGITAALAAAPDVADQFSGVNKVDEFAKPALKMGDKGFLKQQAQKGLAKVASFAEDKPFTTMGIQGSVDAATKLKEIEQDQIDAYNRKLMEDGIRSKTERRTAIRNIYTGIGYDEDYVDSMLDRYGYKKGGGVMAAASMSNAMKKYYDQLEKLKKEKEKKASGGRVGLFFGGKADVDPRAATFVSNMTDRFIQSGMDPEEAREKALDIAREEFPEDEADEMSTREAADFAAEGFKSAFGVESLFPTAPKPMGITPGFGNLPRMAEGGDVMSPEEYFKEKGKHKKLNDFERMRQEYEEYLYKQKYGPRDSAAEGGSIGEQFEEFLMRRQEGIKDNQRRRLKEEFEQYMRRKDSTVEAAEGGLMNLDGNEMDLRGGGFVPIGKKEKADDVPARLSKNEFVMTADAVRGAGGGDVNEGAKRMYQTMDRLEAMA